MSRRSEQGFSLIEMIAVTTTLTIVLMAILSTADLVGGSVRSNDQRASLEEVLRTTLQKLHQNLRPALVSTVQTRATAADVVIAKKNKQDSIVDAALGGDPVEIAQAQAIVIPAVGDWIFPYATTNLESLRFRAAPGELTMNIRKPTTPRHLEFIRTETENGKDDDGDGLIDEGDLVLWSTDYRTLVARGVEEFTITLNGKVCTVSLICARRDAKKRVYRMKMVEQMHIRNN